MKKLTEADIIRLMNEEWDKRVATLTEDLELVLGDNVGATIVSPELKVRHKTSGLLYTVSSVGPRNVILRTPEEENFIVDKDELESSYELG